MWDTRGMSGRRLKPVADNLEAKNCVATIQLLNTPLRVDDAPGELNTSIFASTK